MDRRKFIQSIGAGAAFVLLNSRLGKAADLTRIKEGDGSKRWMDILEYARWCPSPHNTQPWKVKILSDDEIEIFYEPKRLLPEEDLRSAFMIMGLTMFTECIRIAAAPYGMTTTVTYFEGEELEQQAAGLRSFAVVKLVPASDLQVQDRELIRQRKTSRLHYKGKAVSAETGEELKKILLRHGHHFTHSNEKEMVDFVMELNSFTMFSDMENDKARNEIGKWVRTTDAQAHASNDGLWYHCMRFPGKLMEKFFFHHEKFSGPFKHRFYGKVYRNSMKGTKTVAWIKGGFGNKQDWISCGKAMLEMWLFLTQHSLFLHPFGSVITNPGAHKKLSERVGVKEEDGKLWLLMRLGYSDEPPRSLRRTVNDILIP